VEFLRLLLEVETVNQFVQNMLSARLRHLDIIGRNRTTLLVQDMIILAGRTGDTLEECVQNNTEDYNTEDYDSNT